MKRNIFDEDHRIFRDSFREFVKREITPFHEQWEKDGIVPREVWRKAGEYGFLCMSVPEEYGGAGVADYRYNLIVNEELTGAGASGPGFSLQSDVVLPYLLSFADEDQKRRWLPGMVSGELITAIAMTEPGAGSDLAAIQTTAEREGDHYLLNGSKTFITNGIQGDLVIVVARTSREERPHQGISLLVVERGMEGFARGKKLKKIGLTAQDTAELFFSQVKVPAENLLGEEGKGFRYLMQQLPQERLTIAVTAIAAAEAALEWTVTYWQERKAFGQPIGKFQNSRFKLAEMKTEIEIGRVFVDRCVMEHNEGTLKAEEASMAKWWTTELQKRVVDQCLQLHGGYGYMREYPIAKAFLDGRAATIYGGSTEIMKEMIGRAMGF
ncbi:MAG: acyl-CoA dehydrogenase family protein [Pyrinomonadaceae bacterium]